MHASKYKFLYYFLRVKLATKYAKYEIYVKNWSRNNLAGVCKANRTHSDALPSLLGACVYFGIIVHPNGYVEAFYLTSTVAMGT